MEKPSRRESTESGTIINAWYYQPRLVQHKFWGVFEGGGAKGLAYVGALKCMRDQRCWFDGVAGASAGAITAALIAAGLSPEEIEGETETALACVRSGFWSGLRRLETTSGFFPSQSLHQWLNDLLENRLRAIPGSSPVTFSRLFEATKIELNVVAADISEQRQIIFSHHDTPDCAVADAVVASSSIPFAFPSMLLAVPERKQEGKVYHHTIVDGGVWSNFPMFIFEDCGFRHRYGRHPENLDAQQVLGFLLDESDPYERPCGKEIKFAHDLDRANFRPLEWYQPERSNNSEGLGTRLLGAALYPLALLGRFANWNGGVERGRWPTPRKRWGQHVVEIIDGTLGGSHPWLWALVVCFIVVLGAWAVGSYIAKDQWASLLASDWSQLLTYPFRLITVLLGLIGIALSILAVFVTIVGIGANFLLLRTVRRILYGLVTTYVAGPGAPHWAKERKNIVALPIPPEIGTLSFEMDEAAKKSLLDAAYNATEEKLKNILPKAAGPGSVAELPVEVGL